MKSMAVLSGQPLMRSLDHSSRNTSVLAVMTPVFLLLLALGCGGKKQDLRESRNYYLDARRAIKEGDSAKAIEALNASIESQPSTWAYFELAKQHLEQGDEQAAQTNCDKALELDSEMAEALWLHGELKKPDAKRFKGRFKNPPGSRK